MTETTTPQAAFPLVETKLSPPALRPGTVSRRVLLNRLRASADLPVVTISAPAGFGKTTLAAQWAAREERPVAWATADRRDNDPVVLLTYPATGLARVGSIDGRPAVLSRDRRAPVRHAKHCEDASDLVYGKLGVTSRSEAVARAAELGLVDAAAVPARGLPETPDS